MINLFIFAIGACVGSFVNVVVARFRVLPIVNARSKCMTCNTQLEKRDLIPIFSYVLQRGRCRNCSSKFSSEYMWVELVMGIMAVMIWGIVSMSPAVMNTVSASDMLDIYAPANSSRSSGSINSNANIVNSNINADTNTSAAAISGGAGKQSSDMVKAISNSAESKGTLQMIAGDDISSAGYAINYWKLMAGFVFYLSVFALLAIIALYDLRHKVVPMEFSGLLIIMGIVASLYRVLALGDPYITLLSGILIALPFALIFAISKGKWVGFGDVMVYAGVGWALGMAMGFTVLFYSVWIGAVVAIMLMLLARRDYGLKTELPFAPFIVIAAIIVFMSHADILGINELLSR